MSVTDDCNKRCKGCYATTFGEGTLSYEIMEQVVGESEEAFNVKVFGVVGGEPLVRKDDMARLFEAFPRTPFVLFTNATFLDAELAQLFRGLGNVYPILNVPGLEATTDEWRGEGSFEEVRQASSALRKNRVPFGFGANASATNYREVTSREFLNKMSRMGFLFGLYFKYSQQPGSELETDMLLTPEHVINYKQRLAAQKEHPVFVIDKHELYARGELCPAANGKLINVTNDGYITPCIQSPARHEEFNLRARSLPEIVNRMHRLVALGKGRESGDCYGTISLAKLKGDSHVR